MPLEPLWDIVLPLFSLTIGTSLGALGMQLTLGLTFVPWRVLTRGMGKKSLLYTKQWYTKAYIYVYIYICTWHILG